MRRLLSRIPQARFGFPLTWLALLFLLPVLCLRAQEPPDSQVTIRRSVNLVLVDVIVSDKKGNTLSGLRANDFEILDETHPQAISHFSQDVIPMAIALIVDVSGSMRRLLGPTRDALRKSLPSLKKEDRVALFSFAGRPNLLVRLTSNFQELTKKIRGLDVEGDTNINDAVAAAADYLHQTAPEARSIIILVSDMIPTSAGKIPAADVQQKLLTSEVTFFGIRLPNRHNPKLDYATQAEAWAQFSVLLSKRRPGAVVVDKLADDSGGFVLNVYRFEGIPVAFETLLQIVKTRYTLGFYPSPSGQEGSLRQIEVRLKNKEEVERVMPGALLRFRSQYRVPRPEPAKPVP